MKLSLRILPIAGFASGLAFAIACSNSDGVSIGDDCQSGFCSDSGPVFVAPTVDGGDASDASVSVVPLLECIGTECPAPYATCGTTPSFLCQTNLTNDPNNCGACGVKCESFDGISLSGSCVDSKCTFQCELRQDGNGNTHQLADCNGILDDGCETDLSADPASCGVCGNACAAGQRCINGKCGCSGGKTDCNGRCTDTAYDDSNCATCGNYCDYMPPTACAPALANTYYGCAESTCNTLKCTGGFGDCNKDLAKGCGKSDGCEANLQADPNNCGACGVKCGAGQECRDDGNGPQCLDTCQKANQTQCTDGCRDLLSDRFNCGACGSSCQNPRANQKTSCEKGFCDVECLPGFADCNGDPSDGCEVDLSVHPANCGACGHACDFGVGQPCIEGKCLMVECDAGVAR